MLFAIIGCSITVVVVSTQLLRDHMRADHPDLLDKVSDADLHGWIEEV